MNTKENDVICSAHFAMYVCMHYVYVYACMYVCIKNGWFLLFFLVWELLEGRHQWVSVLGLNTALALGDAQ